MKKSFTILLAVFFICITLMSATTLTLSIMTMTKVNAMEKSSDSGKSSAGTHDSDNEDDADEPGGENGVLIAETYTILSTEAISDAYLSGDSSDLSDEDLETLELASAVLDEVIQDGMSDYEKECAVFEWIHENIHIDDGGLVLIQASPENVSTPHGVLKYKNAVCVGYATTFRLMMQMMDIPCKVVHNTSDVHSWDLVQLDGNWYHVDLYSADNLKDASAYLNLPDALMQQEWNRSQYPAADCYDYCYIYQNAETIDDMYLIPEKLKDAFTQNASYLNLLYKPVDETDEATINYMMATMLERTASSEEYGNYYYEYSVSEVGDMLFICASIVNENEFGYDEPDYDDIDVDKVDSAITDAFGELTPSYDYGDYFEYQG